MRMLFGNLEKYFVKSRTVLIGECWRFKHFAISPFHLLNPSLQKPSNRLTNFTMKGVDSNSNKHNRIALYPSPS